MSCLCFCILQLHNATLKLYSSVSLFLFYTYDAWLFDTNFVVVGEIIYQLFMISQSKVILALIVRLQRYGRLYNAIFESWPMSTTVYL